MHLRKLFSLLMSLMVVSSAVAQLNLKDLTGGKYRPVSPDGVNPMADGESYARIEDDKRIVRCSFKDGKVEETLFDVDDVRGRVHIREIDDYIISPKGTTSSSRLSTNRSIAARARANGISTASRTRRSNRSPTATSRSSPSGAPTATWWPSSERAISSW